MRSIPLLLTVLFLGFASATQAADEHRNVILFVVDDQGFQAGCYGNEVVKTPGIDKLAANGTRFTRAHCTTASCSASRSVLMTGLFNHATGHYGHAHGYNHFSTYESVPTLPVLLEEDGGYRTCSIGKYHLAPKYVYRFQDYRNDGVQGNRNSHRMAANALEWIDEGFDGEGDARKQTKPFFLYYCSSDPHRGGGPGGFANYNDDPDHYPGVESVKYEAKDVVVPPWLPDTPECRRELAEYYQAISRLDQGMVELLDGLEERGLWGNTMVIFLSDNGPPFPGAKTTLYEPGSNLPLIVRNPFEEKKGTTTDAVVTWADITPTILDFCQVEPKPRPAIRTRENDGALVTKGPKQPVTFHGKSFLDALDQEHAPDHQTGYLSHTFHEITMYYPVRGVVDGKYKYLFNVAHELEYPFASDLFRSPTWQSVLKSGDEYYGNRRIEDYLHRPRHELYDLSRDPWELDNLADDPEHVELLEKLQGKVKAWQKRTRDPWLLKWEYE